MSADESFLAQWARRKRAAATNARGQPQPKDTGDRAWTRRWRSTPGRGPAIVAAPRSPRSATLGCRCAARWALGTGGGRYSGRTREGLKFADSPLEGDGFEPSVPRSRVAGRGQAARNQIFRRTTSAKAYVRRNKAADRLVRRAPDQPSRNLPSRPFLFRHQRARRGAWHGADDLRWQRS
jgi:hypothetical protein